MRSINRLWQANWSFILFIGLMFVFRSSIADWYHVPSGSMEPNLIAGDRIFVDKTAYALEVPFTDIKIFTTGKVQRGDIVTINSSAADEHLVKRVIGVPGDNIGMIDNRLYINDQPVRYERLSGAMRNENLDPLTHTIKVSADTHPLSTFAPVTVPKGHVLVLGDNRNKSADSRVHGFVPIEELQGKALRIVASLDKTNYWLPRKDRWLKPLI
ncbi:signal peptidase I [Alteromonas sp. ASW11-130]|uniref:signal peptidase I n=1 Tax=Alteromonas sp. ASW11-130 TaxID=3015775 RepID=UPI0022425D8C|nr:signal peptidase I [Alteromonas sp. ASW11-130]MCW8092519.1 signal peptidase I [Alteromonas sp. ASW11-130]